MTKDCLSPCHQPPRRHAAGEDPVKRQQILMGAWQEFMANGFDAATMSGICRRAGVSKGTLYVYFHNKEDLFVALVEARRSILVEELTTAMSSHCGIETRLTLYAKLLLRSLASDKMVRVHRIVVAMAERMPDLTTRFFDAGARVVLRQLAQWLVEAEAAGELQLQDAERAAQQFSELAIGAVWRERLFGARSEPPSEDAIDELARDAVRIFMAAHGVPTKAPG